MKLSKTMYNIFHAPCVSISNEAKEREKAKENLSMMTSEESIRKSDMKTLLFSNGTMVSFTNEDRLKEYEERYARMGVKVIKRY